MTPATVEAHYQSYPVFVMLKGYWMSRRHLLP